MQSLQSVTDPQLAGGGSMEDIKGRGPTIRKPIALQCAVSVYRLFVRSVLRNLEHDPFYSTSRIPGPVSATRRASRASSYFPFIELKARFQPTSTPHKLNHEDFPSRYWELTTLTITARSCCSTHADNHSHPNLSKLAEIPRWSHLQARPLNS